MRSLLLGTVFAVAATAAQAAPVVQFGVKIVNAAGSVQVIDGGGAGIGQVADSDGAADGSISIAVPVSVGQFRVASFSAMNGMDPVSGNPTFTFSLNTTNNLPVNINNNDKALAILFSVTGFTTNGNIEFNSSASANLPTNTSGTNKTSLSYSYYFDSTNALFGTGTHISVSQSSTATNNNSFGASLNDPIGEGDPNPIAQTPSLYALTWEVTISGIDAQRTASAVSGTISVVGVPEPASLALFGLGLAALGFIRRRDA